MALSGLGMQIPSTKQLLKNLDLFKQVVFECVESSMFGFKETPLPFPSFPRLELIFEVIPLKATDFPSSFPQVIWAALTFTDEKF